MKRHSARHRAEFIGYTFKTSDFQAAKYVSAVETTGGHTTLCRTCREAFAEENPSAGMS